MTRAYKYDICRYSDNNGGGLLSLADRERKRREREKEKEAEKENPAKRRDRKWCKGDPKFDPFLLMKIVVLLILRCT